MLRTREVTGNRCLRQRWCQTREVVNKAHVFNCLLACLHACMHACMTSCMLHLFKRSRISPPHQLPDQEWDALMALMPAQILTSRRHCTAPSSLSGHRDLKQSCCPRPQRAVPRILVCFHQALMQPSLMTAALLAVEHDLCMYQGRRPEVKVQHAKDTHFGIQNQIILCINLSSTLQGQSQLL